MLLPFYNRKQLSPFYRSPFWYLTQTTFSVTSLLADVPMVYSRTFSLTDQMIRQILRQRHRTMMSAGTSHSDHQLAFSFCTIQRVHIVDQIDPAFDEALRLLPFHHIVSYRCIQASLMAQLFNIIRIWQTTNIKNQIGLRRDSIFKTKTHALHHQRIAGIPQKQVGNSTF